MCPLFANLVSRLVSENIHHVGEGLLRGCVVKCLSKVYSFKAVILSFRIAFPQQDREE